ncbi:hypothetical protein BC829DRAFT_416916 [Chytridium lagenaria]|nr:hypothetical protein BC829DRAFT_416916 [Chytridium lagenaria]
MPVDDFKICVVLDECGVLLWNETCQRKHQGCSSLEIAELRHLAYILIRTAVKTSSDLRCVNKMLDLATRVGKAWLKAKNYEKADELFQQALAYSECHCFQESPSYKSICLLQSYRAQMLWEKSKCQIAFQIFNKTRTHWTSNLGYIAVCVECAKSSIDTSDSVDWLKSGLEFIETNEILLLLAHALLKLKKYDMVENTCVLRKVLSPGAKRWECKKLHKCPQLGVSGIDWILEANDFYQHNREFFESLCLAKISFLASTEMMKDPSTIQLVRGVVTDCVKMNFSSESTHVAQLTVWRSGDKALEENRLEEAISWFKIALQLSTDELQDVKNISHLRRKIALTYLDLGALEEAKKYSEIVEESDPNNIRTAFLNFLIAVEEDDIDAATSSLTKFQLNQQSGSDDVGLDYLLSAAERAFKKGNRKILQTVLETIAVYIENYDVMKDSTGYSGLIFTIRCLLQLIDSADANISTEEYFVKICGYLQKGLAAFESWKQCSENDELKFQAELSWYYTFTWNSAVSAAEKSLSQSAIDLFRISVRLLKMSSDEALVEKQMHLR